MSDPAAAAPAPGKFDAAEKELLALAAADIKALFDQVGVPNCV